MPRSPQISSTAISTAVADRGDPTLPVILEYQSPSTAIVNAPVPRVARGISWTVGSMVLACFAAKQRALVRYAQHALPIDAEDDFAFLDEGFGTGQRRRLVGQVGVVEIDVLDDVAAGRFDVDPFAQAPAEL